MAEKIKFQWRLIVILGLLAAFGPLSLDMYLPALPRVAEDLHTSTTNAQLSLTACLVGLAIGQVFVGPLTDLVGRRRPLLVALVIYSVTSILSAFAPNVYFLIFYRFIQGCAGGAGAVISRAISSDLYQGRALTKFFSFLMLINGLGPILAPVIGGIILSYSTWHTVFYILASFGILMFLLSTTLEESLPVEKRTVGAGRAIIRDFKLLLMNQRFSIMLFIQAMTYGALFSYIAASPFITQNLYGLTAQQFSYLFAFNGLGLLLFSQLTGKLIDYMNEFSILKFGQNIQFLGMFISAVSLMLHLPIWILMMGFFLMVSPVSMIGTVGFSIAMQVHKQGIGSASALLGLVQFLSGGLISPLTGVMGDASVVPFVVIIITCALLANVLRIITSRQFKYIE